MKGKFIIFLLTLLMIASIAVFDGLFATFEEASVIATKEVVHRSTTGDRLFDPPEMAREFVKMQDIVGKKSLDEYYANRAFAGAPPIIPHPLLSEQGIGGQSCLQCHSKGGYVDRFNAFAPITPHPEYLNCRQCHVPVTTNNLLVGNSFERTAPKGKSSGVLDGAPPAIPHTLQLRTHCLACHAGPSAPKEIRVSHPERINCMQCHAPSENRAITWTRQPVDTEKGGKEQ